MKINPSKLERYFARHEFSAPYLLCASDCETFTVDEICQLEEGGAEVLRHFRLGYTETQGCPLLREQISQLYSHTGPAQIVCCAGAEEGIFIFMNLILEKGDQIIVQSPAYQSLYEVAAALGSEVVPWFVEDIHREELNPDLLESLITPKTRAIVVNFPHNPTGFLPSREQFQQIIGIARKHDLYLFSDEVYRFLEYDPLDRLPAACDFYEKAVSLGVMSKSFGLAGLRIGWVGLHDQELLNRFLTFKDYTTICSNGVGEFLATLALKHRHVLLKRNMQIIHDNWERLQAFFKRFAAFFTCHYPLAGPLIFPKLQLETLGFTNADDFCDDLVSVAGVLLLPGSTFNSLEPERHVRFGFGRKSMSHALDRLADYLATR